MIKILLSITTSILICISCTQKFTEDNIIGVYVPEQFVNTKDTLNIMKNGRYSRKIYNRNGKLLLSMKGGWNFSNKDNNSIHFRPYFTNLDRDLDVFPELLADTAGGWVVDLVKDYKQLKFCMEDYQDDKGEPICYLKIK
jgi:hypothetical protein